LTDVVISIIIIVQIKHLTEGSLVNNKLISLMIGTVYTATVVSIVIIAFVKNYTEIITPSIIAICTAAVSLVMVIKRNER